MMAAAAIDLAGKVLRAPQEKLELAVKESAYPLEGVVACAKRLNKLILERQEQYEDYRRREAAGEQIEKYANCRMKYTSVTLSAVAKIRVQKNFYTVIQEREHAS